MDVLYLLIPMSVLLVFAVMGLFAWSLHAGQFDDLEREGERILDAESPGVDVDQDAGTSAPEQSDPTEFSRGDVQ